MTTEKHIKLLEKAKKFYTSGQFDKFIQRIFKDGKTITEKDIQQENNNYSKSDRIKLKRMVRVFTEIKPDDIIVIREPLSNLKYDEYLYIDNKGEQYSFYLIHSSELTFIMKKIPDSFRCSSMQTIYKSKTCHVFFIIFNIQEKVLSINGDRDEGLNFILNDYKNIK